MLTQARTLIDESLKTAKKPCVLWSGGMDSSLVLALIREFAEVEILHFRIGREIEKIVGDTEVTIYPPVNRYFVPNQTGLSLIDEYSFHGLLPLIRDFESGERCALELGDVRLDLSFDYDTVFTGVLKDDEHFLTGKSPFGKAEIAEFNGVTFVHPLMKWTKAEVEIAVKAMGVKYVEGTGEVKACTNCLTGNTYCPKEKKDIPLVEWHPQENLRFFKERYGYVNVT